MENMKKQHNESTLLYGFERVKAKDEGELEPPLAYSITR